MQTWSCVECGIHNLQVPNGPVRCPHSATATTASTQIAENRNCIHLGQSVGSMTCGCGVAFHCALLDKLCSHKKPIDQFVQVGKTMLDSAHYQWCGDCKHHQ